MRALIKSEIKKTFRRMDANVLILLGLWPAMLCMLILLKPDVFKMSGVAIGAYEFANYMVVIQNEIFLPLLISAMIASMSFYQEIHKKVIYFYKDLPRKKILIAKYLSVYSVYFVFLFLYIVVSFIAYYLEFRSNSLATGTFMAYPEEAISGLYTAIQIILGATLYIHVGITLAIRISTGLSIFGMTLFYMFAKIVPNFKFLKFIFPIGYKEVISFGAHSLLYSSLLSVIVFGIYHMLLFVINKKYFDKMQFN